MKGECDLWWEKDGQKEYLRDKISCLCCNEIVATIRVVDVAKAVQKGRTSLINDMCENPACKIGRLNAREPRVWFGAYLNQLARRKLTPSPQLLETEGRIRLTEFLTDTLRCDGCNEVVAEEIPVFYVVSSHGGEGRIPGKMSLSCENIRCPFSSPLKPQPWFGAYLRVLNKRKLVPSNALLATGGRCKLQYLGEEGKTVYVKDTLTCLYCKREVGTCKVAAFVDRYGTMNEETPLMCLNADCKAGEEVCAEMERQMEEEERRMEEEMAEIAF
jgi:hypothetical protein